ncbi:MAG: hydrogenase formation protein HypD [Clostridiales Family XIII bacterium]|jgi:hydrogenase expression/formation protein HypD|nr:hydrogenase formation protein HypD [Clostridiales Family XIII bacterium]
MSFEDKPFKIMEVCGTHTSAIFKSGIRDLLPENVRLVSGPGCPVCVTPPSYIDRCIRIARTPGHVLLCFGDMMKVPARGGSTLSDAKAAGRSVRMVYAPFDALALAAKNPDIEYTVAAVGFETTAPAYALLIEEAQARGLTNIRLLTALKSAVRAIEWICETGEDVDAFLCPGHVSVITGSAAYAPLAEKYGRPFVVAGFEAKQLEAAVRDCICGGSGVRNLYPEAVSEEGNARAKALLETYFDLTDAAWRGLGTIPRSGYELKSKYARWIPDQVRDDTPDVIPNAAAVIAGADPQSTAAAVSSDTLPPGCRCGDVILGRIDPPDCPLFGGSCTPLRATGPCMVSSEGACGIWYRNRSPVIAGADPQSIVIY